MFGCCFLHRRVDEFKECGDMDMMMQYVKDVQAVQKKIAECVESIGFINEVRNSSQRNVCEQRV